MSIVLTSTATNITLLLMFHADFALFNKGVKKRVVDTNYYLIKFAGAIHIKIINYVTSGV